MSKNESQKKKLSEDQIKQLRTLSAVRLPMEMIATIFDMSKDTLESLYKKDFAVRSAIDEGRATASANIRKTLYFMAIGTPEDKDKEIEAVKPDFKALQFWCLSQEGFKTTERLEHTGANGGPIKTQDVTLTPEQKDEKIAKLSKLLKLTE